MSYAPRSSVASTIYSKSAVIVAPAQTGMRAKPAMVSVRANNATSGASTPPVPSVDYEKYNGLGTASPANSTFSVGSTFLNNANAHAAMRPKVQLFPGGSGAKEVTVGKPKTSEEPRAPPQGSTDGEPAAATTIDESPAKDQGPFSDPPQSPAAQSPTSRDSITEEATRRSPQRDETPPKGRERSPFGDENATHD
jgi:hypothetical protein